MNLEKVANLPDAAFKDVTENPESAARAAQDNLVADSELFKTVEHVENASILGGADAATVAPPAKVAPYSPTGAPTNFLGGDTPCAPGVKLGGAIGGKTAVELMDSILPSLTIALAGYLGYRLQRSELQLTADEKRTIAPAMQAYLDTININFDNPLYNLLFVAGSIYAAKIVSILPNVQSQPKRQKGSKEAQTDTVEGLIKETMRTRKKGRADAVKFLTENGQLKRKTDV